LGRGLLRQKIYRAAVVMSDAAVEAMLLALLKQEPDADIVALRRMSFG
jgi:hypothetical protein